MPERIAISSPLKTYLFAGISHTFAIRPYTRKFAVRGIEPSPTSLRDAAHAISSMHNQHMEIAAVSSLPRNDPRGDISAVGLECSGRPIRPQTLVRAFDLIVETLGRNVGTIRPADRAPVDGRSFEVFNVFERFKDRTAAQIGCKIHISPKSVVKNDLVDIVVPVLNVLDFIHIPHGCPHFR